MLDRERQDPSGIQNDAFPYRGGEMGTLIRAFDWTKTSLGPIADWPSHLKSAVGLMILLLIALFHHTALGLQVVIEDYVHSGARFAVVIAIQLCCYGLAVVGIFATLRIAFGGE